MKKIAILCCWLVQTALTAQGAYHSDLQNNLQTTYGLPAPQSWVLPNTEAATFAQSFNYGGTTATIAPVGQPFSEGRQRTVTQGTDPWSAGHIYPNQTSIASGDKCLLVIWLRSPTLDARVNFFAENATTYSKEVFAEVSVNDQWQRYLLPFSATQAYSASGLQIGLHLAFQNQTIEIGGAACLNYKNTVTLDQLPVVTNAPLYDGADPNAPWRAQAAADIDQYRRANLHVVVLGPSGNAVENVTVRAEMLQHEFKFGTAVVSNLFNGGSNFNPTYEQKLLDLDGLGHRFNEVVFENDLKWPAWEQGWFSSKPAIASDMQWLADQGMTVRGHNLMWPAWQYSPPDINANVTPAYLKSRARDHLEDILTYPGIGTACVDWDVLNEITANNEYAQKLAGSPGYTTGREWYAEVFRQADSLAPNSTLYLNDYVAIEQADNPSNGIATWRSRIDELVAAGAPIEGIGFQGHFSAKPTGIPRVKEVYDAFWAAYGLEAKVTEYDINDLVAPDVQARYLRDFLTVTFAHPSQKGFLMWGFWDGAHWMGNAPIFNEDWSLKPSGEAFIDQVFHQWWTDEFKATNTAGQANFRGYRGKYRVTVTCPDGSTQTQEITLDGDKTLTINSSCTVSNTESSANWAIQVSPNPSRSQVTVSWADLQVNGDLHLLLTDVLGKVVHTQTVAPGTHTVGIDVSTWPQGVYSLQLAHAGQTAVRQLVVGAR